MAVGLTLCDNQVSVFFVDDGVYSLLPLSCEAVGMRDFGQFLSALTDMSVPLMAEVEAVAQRQLNEMAFKPELRSHEELARSLANFWAVMVF